MGSLLIRWRDNRRASATAATTSHLLPTAEQSFLTVADKVLLADEGHLSGTDKVLLVDERLQAGAERFLKCGADCHSLIH